jgi:hypothetical protein
LPAGRDFTAQVVLPGEEVGGGVVGGVVVGGIVGGVVGGVVPPAQASTSAHRVGVVAGVQPDPAQAVCVTSAR